MRGIFGLAGVLIALLIVALLVKRQLNATQQAMPALQPSAVQESAGQNMAPASTVRQQGQQFEQQYKNALQGAMQKARPAPDDNSQ